MLGMMKRNTITTPCMVKRWLYVSASTMVLPGVSSSMRTSRAKIPPRRNAKRTKPRYMTPIRLWSSVVNHDRTPFPLPARQCVALR